MRPPGCNAPRGLVPRALVVFIALLMLQSVGVAMEPAELSVAGDLWRLSNGIVEATFDAAQMRVTDLARYGGENVLTGGSLYLDGDWSGHGYWHFAPNETTVGPVVAARTERWVDIAVRQRPRAIQDGALAPCMVEWHLVLEAGAPGLHTYTVVEHLPGAGPMTLSQLRVIMLADRRFTDFALTPSWTGQLADYPWKYMLGRAFEPWSTYGLVDPKAREGVFAVFGAKHWYRGPDQRELTLHEGPYIAAHYEAGHYGLFPTSRKPTVPVLADGWRKVYGPVFLMLQQQGTAQGMYARAQARAGAEARAFPPEWLAAKIGPLATVTGRLGEAIRTDAVRIVLRNDRYVFWTTAIPGRSFRIPRVLPGEYELIARQGPHAIGRRAGVRVRPETLDVGEVALEQTVRPERLLWEIGTLDDSCEEFAGGWRCWDPHGYEAFTAEAGHDFVYVVGESRADRDWYWLHPGPYDTWAGSRTHPWEIRFDYKQCPSEPLLLHLVLSDTFAAVGVPPPVYRIELNGRHLASLELLPGGQAATYCTAPIGTPQHHCVTLPTAALRQGTNRLVVCPERYGYVMYDYIALETTSPP